MSMPDDAPTPDDILNAIKATGFLMEQRVASCVESLGFHTWTGYPFADPEESKSREIDVRGYRQIRKEDTKLIIELELLCECKSNDHPFVFLTRGKKDHDRRLFCPDQYVFPFDKYETRTEKMMTYLPGFRHFEFAKHHYYEQENQKAVQFCKISARKEELDGKPWRHLRLRHFLSLGKGGPCPNESHRHGTQTVVRPNGWKSINILMPIVVLHGRMYRIDAVAQPLEVSEISHISFVRELSSKAISGRISY